MCIWETGLDDAVAMRSSHFFPDRLAQPVSNVQPSDRCRIDSERRPLKLQCHFKTFLFQSCFFSPLSCLLPILPSSPKSSRPISSTQMWGPSADAFVQRGVYGLMCIDRYFRLENTNSYMRCLVKSLVWSHIWRPVGLLENWQLSVVSMTCLGQRNIGRCHQHACVRLTVFSSLTV